MVSQNGTSSPSATRLNLLLSHGGWPNEAWFDQLPRLLAPLGVRSITASSGREAAEVIRSTPIHIVVVDLGLPLEAATGQQKIDRIDTSGGTRLLEILRRLEPAPPTVVIRREAGASSASRKTLTDALRQGAFAVHDSPVGIETLLDTMRRILRRHYSDLWPGSQC